MNSIMKYISQMHRCFRSWRSDKMKEEGLNGMQQHYLFHICMQPGISQEKLSEHVMVNKSNVARQLSTLENDGWITRRICENDKRVYEVYPTEKAKQVLPEIRKQISSWNALLLEELTPDEQRLLLDILPKLSNKAKLLAESERDLS